MEITIDLRYSVLEYELWALRHMLGLIEPEIERLATESEARTLADLKASDWYDDPAERDMAFQDIREIRDYVLPRFMRGPFLISLWACFEAGVRAVATRVHDEQLAPIALQELRSDSFVKQARRYFSAILLLPLDEDEARYSRLVDLYRVRNALAHANGLRELMGEDDWSAVCDALRRQNVVLNEDGRGVIVLSHAYVERAFIDVDASIRSLISRAKSLTGSRTRRRGSNTSRKQGLGCPRDRAPRERT